MGFGILIMKAIILAAILFSQSISFAGGNIPFLFSSGFGNLPQVAALTWTPSTLQFDGTGGYTQTVSLQNTGVVSSSSVTVSLTASVNGAIYIDTDNCTGNTLIAGGICSVIIGFNGFAPDPATHYLHAVAGAVATSPDIAITNCPGC